MPILKTADDYRPYFPFRSGHINTIFPPLFRRIERPAFLRERWTTPDEDFLDVDWLRGGHSRIAILCHGLEGSSDSQYIRGTANALYAEDWDILAINYRSCSGEINKQKRLYHSGATDDIHFVVEEVEVAYDSIALVGFSLGGNKVLKYTNDGLYRLSPKIKKVIAVSVPVDLCAASRAIGRWENRLYEYRFLKGLRQKAEAKNRQYPGLLDMDSLRQAKSLFDFDNYFTAPLHGFEDALDYYTKCSALPFLKNIHIPTLIINAEDDSFLGPTCYPVEIAEANPKLFLLMPQYGGHVGFTCLGKERYWEEEKIVGFLGE